MEQQSGPGGQGDYLHDTPEPGEMRRLAWVNIARGADGLLFFRERSCRFGAEEYWCGVLDHDNVPRRRYREAARLGEELRRLGPELLGTSVEIEIGIAGGDFTSLHGHLALSHGLPGPRAVAEGIHGHFYAAGHAVGCVHPADSLAGLRLYLVPHLAQFDAAWLTGWSEWVESGGVLVVGARTGAKDVRNNVTAATLPGPVRDLAGMTVEEFGRQNRPLQRPLHLTLEGVPTPVLTDHWYEELVPDAGTVAVGTWEGRHLTGKPAVTLRRQGGGSVIYVGTYLTTVVMAALTPLLARLGALPSQVDHVEGVEQVVRTGAGRRLRFLINHREEEVEVPLGRPGLELITRQRATGRLLLPAGEVAIIREDLSVPAISS
jgi:beta-galactosidase